MLRVVHDFAFSLDVLDDYDHGRISLPKGISEAAEPVSEEEALRIINGMKKRYGDGALFDREQDGRFGDAYPAWSREHT